MSSGAQPSLRFPLILLAIANLALLAMRLSPWQEVFNLPGNGATGIDPGVCLIGYILLIFIFGAKKQDEMSVAMGAGTLLGLLGGAVMVGEIVLKAQAAQQDTALPAFMTKGLLVTACLLWGAAGWNGARVTGNSGLGMISGAWSAMVSSLMAATAVLAEMYSTAASPTSQDPWKQYEGLALGNSATQALVHSLNSVTFFLLVGPLAGAAAGLVFAFFAPAKKS